MDTRTVSGIGGGRMNYLESNLLSFNTAKFDEIVLDQVDVIVLCAIGADGKPVNSRTKLQNILFIYSEYVPMMSHLLDYYPGESGPKSSKVEKSYEKLIKCNMIQNDDTLSIGYQARDAFDKIIELVGVENMKYLIEIKDFINSMERDEMLAYIYTKYPKISSQSVNFTDIIENNEYHITGLASKGIISGRLGAHLLGLEYRDFYPMVHGRMVIDQQPC